MSLSRRTDANNPARFSPRLAHAVNPRKGILNFDMHGFQLASPNYWLLLAGAWPVIIPMVGVRVNESRIKIEEMDVFLDKKTSISWNTENSTINT